jgi:hypothetical protein
MEESDQWKEPMVPTEREAEWALEPDWMLWREEKSLTTAVNQTSIHQLSPLCSLVSTVIRLSKCSTIICLGLNGKR